MHGQSSTAHISEANKVPEEAKKNMFIVPIVGTPVPTRLWEGRASQVLSKTCPAPGIAVGPSERALELAGIRDNSHEIIRICPSVQCCLEHGRG